MIKKICVFAFLFLFQKQLFSQIIWELKYKTYSDTALVCFQGSLIKEQDGGTLDVVCFFYENVFLEEEGKIKIYFKVDKEELRNVIIDTFFNSEYKVKRIDSLNMVRFEISNKFHILDVDKPIYLKGTLSFIDNVYTNGRPYFTEDKKIAYFLNTDSSNKSIKVGYMPISLISE